MNGYPDFFEFLIGFVFGVAFGVMSVFFFGCDESDRCPDVGATKCEDNAVMYCAPNHEWEVDHDCLELINFDGEVTPAVCCEVGYARCQEGTTCNERTF
jgi:hypothetical protein